MRCTASDGKTYRFSFIIDTGIHTPKIVRCTASDGKTYRQLVKSGDDLRQDAVMQQVRERTCLLCLTAAMAAAALDYKHDLYARYGYIYFDCRHLGPGPRLLPLTLFVYLTLELLPAATYPQP